jgi:hypothetical protein
VGFISGLLGSQTGAGFQAQQANLQGGANQQQAAIGQSQGNQAYNQQQQFVNQLQGINGVQGLSNIANGTGPNPAQAMLNNATGANNSAQASLMAGQRGASQNAGLIARQAAQQGSANQQNAIGQGAALQAQQQLNATNTLASMQGQAYGQLGQQALGQQGAANQALGQQNSANAEIAKQNADTQGQLLTNGLGGALNGLSSAVAMASGGEVSGQPPIAPAPMLPNHRERYLAAIHPHMPKMSSGGSVPAILSPGERYLSPSEAQGVAKGTLKATNAPKVPGQARAKGDNPKNDTIPADLEQGGVVIPRTKANNERSAHDFVAAVMAKSGPRRR